MIRHKGEPGGDTMKQAAPIGPAPVGSVGCLVHAIGGRQCHRAILPWCGTCRRRAQLLFTSTSNYLHCKPPDRAWPVVRAL